MALRRAEQPLDDMVLVGLSMRGFYAEVRRAAWSFAAAGAVGLLLAGLGAWWLSGRAMRPLRRIVATAEKLKATELSAAAFRPRQQRRPRIFAQLISVLNAMMERLHTELSAKRRALRPMLRMS